MPGPAAMRAAAVAAVALALLASGLVARAAAQTTSAATPATTSTATDPNAVVGVPDLTKPPPGRRLTGREVQRIAEAVPKVIRERRKHPGSFPSVYTKGPGRWQVSFFTRAKPAKEFAQVYVDDASGQVTEAWTGFQVAWTMARGYPGAFGRKVN